MDLDFWNNARIGARLAAGFALLMLAVAAVALYGCWVLQGVGGEIRALVDVRVCQVGQARDIKDHLNIVARGVRNAVLLSDPDQVQSEVRRIRDSESKSAYLQALDRFVAQQVSQMDAAAQDAMQTVQHATRWMATVAALAVTARVAQGDLATEEPMAQRRDELGHLLQGLAHMQQSLRQLVGGVRGNAGSVATASTQIAQGNQDLSRRTEQQAGVLQETAATMEELNTTVWQNAQSARQASQLAQDAARVASEGGEVVHRMGQTMEDITASSRRSSRRGRASRDLASRWWPPRSAPWRSAVPRPRARSRA